MTVAVSLVHPFILIYMACVDPMDPSNMESIASALQGLPDGAIHAAVWGFGLVCLTYVLAAIAWIVRPDRLKWTATAIAIILVWSEVGFFGTAAILDQGSDRFGWLIGLSMLVILPLASAYYMATRERWWPIDSA